MPAPRKLTFAVTTVTGISAAHGLPSPSGRGPPADTFHVNDRQGEAHQLRPFFFFRHPREQDQALSIDITDQDRQNRLQALLSEELAVQTARLKQFTEITADTGDPDQAHDRDALLAATRHSIEQITGALRRVAEGAYGRCERCETSIPVERLEILPHARFCVPCQQKQNR